jgi:hypothetical protein
MRESTKNIIYIAFDLLESINKSSNDDSSLITLNKTEFDEAKKELIQLMNLNGQSTFYSRQKKEVLIGTLPSILMDKTKFPDNESIAKLAKESLNYDINTWKKRKREEIIGRIIAKIAEDDKNSFERFADSWNYFVSQDNVSDYANSKKEFVDVWLSFFNQYRGNK